MLLTKINHISPWINNMLNDPSNQMTGASSNPGSSSNPYNQSPYFPTFPTNPYMNPEEQMLFSQWKMQQYQQLTQQNLQQNQGTASQPNSDHASYHLQDEDLDEKMKTKMKRRRSRPRHRRRQRRRRRRRGRGRRKVVLELVTCGTKMRSCFWRSVTFKYPRIQKEVRVNQRKRFGIEFLTYIVWKPKEKIGLFVPRTC